MKRDGPRAVLERYTAFVHRRFASDGDASRHLILFIVGYFLLESITSTLGKTGGGTDTSEIILYTQYWDWGYGGSQPPLPAWVSKAVSDVFGLSLLSLALAKFAMLALMFAAVAVAASRLGLGGPASAAATLGIFTIPEFAWEAQRSLAHTPGMMAFCAIGVAAMIEARKSGSIGAYLLFGLAWAAAILCRYNGMLFFLAIVMTAAILPPWRATVLSWKMGLSLLTCAVLVAPHALWALDHLAAATQRAYKFGIGASGHPFFDRVIGLASLLEVSFNLLVVPLVVAGATLAAQPDHRRSLALPRRRDVDSLPAGVVVVSLLLALVTVLVSGAVSVQNHWLQPAAFLAPMAIAIAASQAGSSGCGADKLADRINLNLASVGFACAIVAAVALPLHSIHSSAGEPHPFKLDYRRFLAELDTNAGVPVGSVVTTRYRIFASLRLVRPELQVVTPELPDPADRLSGPIVIVWEDGASGTDGLHGFLSTLGIPQDGWERHVTQLVREDDPDIRLEVEYSIVRGGAQE